MLSSALLCSPLPTIPTSTPLCSHLLTPQLTPLLPSLDSTHSTLLPPLPTPLISSFLVGKVFADHGLRVIGVDTDDDGLVVDDALEAAMVAHRPAMLYTVPIHGNPTASTMPPHRIEALVRLARKHAVVVASDEVYQLLGFNGYGSDGGGNGNGGDTIREDGEDGKGCSEEGDDVKDSRDSSSRPWRSLATYDDSDDGGNVVVALNSFSKILCPGLRLGWLQAHPSLIEAILERGFMVSGGGLNPFTAAIVEATLEPLAGDTTDAEGGGSVDGDGSSGQGAHLAVVRRALQARSEALLSALHEYLPDVEIAARPEGGYFVWLTLPGGGEEGEGNGEGDGGEGRTNAVVTAVQLLEVAQRGGHRVGFLPGPKFDISEGNGAGPGSLDHCFRLCFAYYNEAELTEGVKRLAAALAQAREEVGGEHY